MEHTVSAYDDDLKAIAKGDKPAYAKGDKPGPKKAPFKAAPKTDARDTSKRFVPPKKKG